MTVLGSALKGNAVRYSLLSSGNNGPYMLVSYKQHRSHDSYRKTRSECGQWDLQLSLLGIFINKETYQGHLNFLCTVSFYKEFFTFLVPKRIMPWLNSRLELCFKEKNEGMGGQQRHFHSEEFPVMPPIVANLQMHMGKDWVFWKGWQLSRTWRPCTKSIGNEILHRGKLYCPFRCLFHLSPQ